MEQCEKEVRRALKANCELVRKRGGHEIWRLPDNTVIQVKCKGRKGSRGWKCVLFQLRKRLRALSHAAEALGA